MFVEREVPGQQCVELLTAESCTDLPQTPTSAAAQKWVERGSCGAVGVVDPFEWGDCGVAVFDEVEHALHEIGS